MISVGAGAGVATPGTVTAATAASAAPAVSRVTALKLIMWCSPCWSLLVPEGHRHRIWYGASLELCRPKMHPPKRLHDSCLVRRVAGAPQLERAQIGRSIRQQHEAGL